METQLLLLQQLLHSFMMGYETLRPLPPWGTKYDPTILGGYKILSTKLKISSTPGEHLLYDHSLKQVLSTYNFLVFFHPSHVLNDKSKLILV